jgi:hypothetical protein
MLQTTQMPFVAHCSRKLSLTRSRLKKSVHMLTVTEIEQKKYLGSCFVSIHHHIISTTIPSMS